MGYHYRVVVPTGLVDEIRHVIEPPDAVAAQVDGRQIGAGDDVTLLTVHSGELDSLTKLRAWAEQNPGDPITVVTMVGTPLPMLETEMASLRSSVMAHQALEVEAPARGTMAM